MFDWFYLFLIKYLNLMKKSQAFHENRTFEIHAVLT